jgi:hypothetical protein
MLDYRSNCACYASAKRKPKEREHINDKIAKGSQSYYEDPGE